MTDFTLEDEALTDGELELFNAIRVSLVSRLFVEFLQQGGPKPHVVLRLAFAQRTPVVGGREWRGCRLAMDIAGQLEGIFHIRPLSYADASNSAHAAFEFGLNRTDWTVGNYISTLNHQQNLNDFDFVGGFYMPSSRTEYVDGCRDFISQFFILLHRWGVVRWHVLRVDRGVFNGTNLRVIPGRTGFHQIIGYSYRSRGVRSTTVESLPIARGVFNDPNFQRTVEYRPDSDHTYLLPYNPPAPQAGDVWWDTRSSAPQGHSSIIEVGEWSEWEWNEHWQRESRTRSNPRVEGGIEWEYRPLA